MIEGRDLGFAYGATSVLEGVDVVARPGRVLGLVGPNGSGKTTLLRLLHGGLRPRTGEVTVDSQPLRTLSPRQVSQRLAVVVQEASGESTLTVAEMVLLGRNARLATFERAGTADHDVVRAALRRVGTEHLARRPFAGLSGGEKQRVLIARALAQEAPHLLLDEPTNHLDVRYQHEVLHLVHALTREVGASVVVVLHDLALAARYCDDLALLDQGRVVANGTTEEVLEPALLTEVYGIQVERITHGGSDHLLLTPFDRPREGPTDLPVTCR